ncbi:MAG: M48 family metalloprotease, partial [Gammaproteobacteria bacterium]|nr:M48 family metalloprotease [Gammaproteobacteria bacterium]
RQQLKFIDDPELKAYLSGLGQKLAAYSDSPDQAFQFYLIEHPALNAFAVPGGHISVHTGLILAAEDESELAAVLAHEIAHITQRHLPRMLDQAQSQSLPALAAVVAAILLGGPAATAALTATNAAMIEKQLSYSRSFEREADAIGIQALSRSGYDTRAMPRFFMRMEQWARIQESNAPEFLRTHPLTTNRIAESQARAESYPAANRAPDSDFWHVRAKIRALYSERPEYVAQTFAANLRDGQFHDEMAERYGLGLALMIIGDYAAARREIGGLVTRDTGRLSYRIAQAEVEMAAGRHQQALIYFEAARELDPENPALNMYYANALLQTGRAAEARSLLRKSIRRDASEPRLHQMLARAEGDDGNALGAHQALAEYHYLRGDSNEALRQLHLAKRYTGDSQYAIASVDARITQIQREMSVRGEKPQERAETRKFSAANRE